MAGALLVAPVACSSDDDAGPSTTTAPTTTTSSTTTTEPSTTSAPPSTAAPAGTFDRLAPGTHHGELVGVESAELDGTTVQVIAFDKVDLLTGDEAVAAAQEDGAIPADQDVVENDYYVRNRNPLVRRLPVAPDAPITGLEAGSPDPVPATLAELLDLPNLVEIVVADVDGVSTVTSVAAVYVP